MALRDDILGNRKFPISPPIEVPGWDGLTEELHFRTLSARDADEIDQKAASGDLKGFRALFAALVLCDKDGKRVFADIDVPALSTMPADPLSWVLDEGKAWNEITDADAEDVEGKSDGPGGDSGSD